MSHYSVLFWLVQVRNIFYYKDYYLKFFEALDVKVKKKFNWTLKLISQVEKVPVKYFKHIEDSTGLYEVRVEVGNNIFRVFSFFDEGQAACNFSEWVSEEITKDS